MSHLVLHIGTHKTGTTTIQDTFWHNAPLLRRRNVIYPKLPYRHTGHHGLIAEQVGLPATYHLKPSGKDVLGELASTYENSDVTLFLSSEEFSRAEESRSVDYCGLSEVFRGFEKITVLCFLRPQWQLIQSIYLEISRYRSPPRPPAFVEESLKSGRCQGLFLNYMELVNRIKCGLPRAEVRIVNFSKARNRRLGILEAALHATNRNISACEMQLVNSGHSNRSPEPLSQWAANLLAEPHVPPMALLSQMIDIFQEESPTSILTRGEIQQINERFAESNAALAERYPQAGQLNEEIGKYHFCREDVNIDHWLGIGRQLAAPMLR